MPVLRSAFIALSRNRILRNFSERSIVGRRMSSRFVAGMEIDDALRVAEAVNQQGMAVTLDSLGESVTSETEAHQAADLSPAAGLDCRTEAGRQHQREADADGPATIAVAGRDDRMETRRTCASSGNFVRIDMEDSSLTQVTLDIVRRLHARPEVRGAIGTVIQAYLYRSESDIEQLLADGIRVRLCKGAYKEPAAVAFPRKADVNANYVRLSEMLLESPVYHALATHDEAMIEAAKSFARQRGIDASRFEFQMLYGVRRDLQRNLVREGYNVRIYVPFGSAWYPYFMRRLAERPANAIFLAKNFFRA